MSSPDQSNDNVPAPTEMHAVGTGAPLRTDPAEMAGNSVPRKSDSHKVGGEVALDSYDNTPCPASEDGLPDERPPTKLFTFRNFLIALPNIVTPCLYGYHIGLVGAYSTLYRFATNCELYKAPTPCETLSDAKCMWMEVDRVPGTNGSGFMCGWRDKSTCSLLHFDQASCEANSDCQWKYSDSECGNRVGYPSIINGLFAGSMIMGAMIGSFLGGVLTKKFNYRLSFLIIGIISTVASILIHVATGVFEYWLLFVARIIIGFAMGWQAVAAPGYVSIFSPLEHQKTMGTFFQVFTAFGSFVAAIIGLGVGQSIQYSSNTNANVMGRMQGFVTLPTLLSILVMGLYFICKDVPKVREVEDLDGAPMSRKSKLSHVEGQTNEPQEEVVEDEAEMTVVKKYTVLQMLGPIGMGFIMACTLQLTGINAMMNYAPTIMSNLGLDALVGNLIVLGWNSITAFGVIPLSKYFTMRTLFLTCTLAGSLSCLFLCGIPVYPGVTPNKSAKEGVAITGIALFILAYELGIGPCFFVLAGDVFPASFRHVGTSLTVMFQFIFNLIINICYPIATEGMSGGPGGDQDKGQAIAFIFFGCIGIVTVIIEFFFLHPWEEETAGQQQQRQQLVADHGDEDTPVA